MKVNHQRDFRISLSNSFEILVIEECQDKPEPIYEENSMSPSFDHTPSKRKQRKQSTKHSKQPEAYITNSQYEEPLVQRKARVVPGRRSNHMWKQPSLERTFLSSVYPPK